MDKHSTFDSRLKESKDLSDELQNLAEYLKEFTGSTAVYVGKVCKPFKSIKEDADDTAHLDPSAEDHIQFIKADSDNGFIVDKILKQNEGVTFKALFGEEEEKEKEEEPEEDENGEKIVKPPKEVLPRHKFIPEVVEDPSVHFFRVPKLGSYLTIKLEYQSCLFEEAFDAAVLDHQDVMAKTAELEKE